MTLVTLFDHAGRESADPVGADAATQWLWRLGIEAGAWPLKERPLSGTPQLTCARELNALQRRFGAVLTDRLRRRGGAAPRDAAGLPPWPESSDEHTHDDHEVRVVLGGSARFVLRAPGASGWAAVDCEAGDWVALPAGLPHAFIEDAGRGVDMLRLFSRPRGWVIRRSGATIPAALRRRDAEAGARALLAA